VQVHLGHHKAGGVLRLLPAVPGFVDTTKDQPLGPQERLWPKRSRQARAPRSDEGSGRSLKWVRAAADDDVQCLDDEEGGG
jgi:hypothetical protein